VWKAAETLDSRIASRGLDPRVHVFDAIRETEHVDGRIKSGQGELMELFNQMG